MATPSDNNNTQNPPTTSLPAAKDNHDPDPEATRENSPTSVFVNSEPVREDQVQNAVKFLSHPRVRGSPVMYRCSFLERKGLTKEEIDEAFRRVPDPTPTVSTTQPVAATEDEKVKSSSTTQPLSASQNLQPASALQSNPMRKMGYFSHFHWTHAIMAVGILAASGAGTALLLKHTIIPRFKSWIRKVVMEEGDEEGAVKGKPKLAEAAAVAAAADVARVSQEMLASKTEEKRYFEELTNLLNYQVQEMKSMISALQKLDGKSSTSGRIPAMEEDDRRVSISHSTQSYSNGKLDVDARSVRSLSPPASMEPSVAPHPKSYMDIMAMIQRGEKPSNIQDINDQPPNPNQPIPDSRVGPNPEEGGHLSKESVEEHAQKEKNGSRMPTRNRSRGRRNKHGTKGHGHGTTTSTHGVEPSKPPPGPRMPDGTRGFAMGRGRPLSSSPS